MIINEAQLLTRICFTLVKTGLTYTLYLKLLPASA